MNQSFTVQGMTCGHCEKAIKRAIARVDPQAEVKIDLSSQQVEVLSNQERAVLAKAMEEEGYATA
jgi:copper chaperone